MYSNRIVLKNIFFLLVGFLGGFVLTYTLAVDETKDDINIISKISTKDEKNNEIKYKEKIILKRELPTFVKKDINASGIDIKDFDEKKWDEFLSLIQKNCLAEISVNTEYSKGNSLLHILCSTKHIDLKLIEELLNQGFDINQKNSEGVTPLLMAINNSSLTTVKKLIELGADLQAIDESGKNALHYALTNERFTYENRHILVDYLIENKGFSFDKGRDYLEELSYPGNKEYLLPIVKNLKEEDFNYALIKMSVRHALDDNILQTIFDNGFKIKDQGSFLLKMIISNVSNDKLQEIIDKNKINVDSPLVRINYSTPLMIAARFGNINRIEIFLKNNADIYILDSKGRSVYDYLEKSRRKKKYKEKIYALLKKYEEK